MTGDDSRPSRVVCHLSDLLVERGLTLVQLATMTGVTVANLSVLKNDRARAVRFTTLTAVCDALGCQPGDLLEVEAQGESRGLPDHPSRRRLGA